MSASGPSGPLVTFMSIINFICPANKMLKCQQLFIVVTFVSRINFMLS